MTRSLHFSAYFLWACATSFALSTADPGLTQALAIIPVVLFYSLFPPRNLAGRLVGSLPFLLVCLGGLAACVSALTNGTPVSGLLRYLALIPAFAVMIPSAGDQARQRDVFQAFALAGLVFCAAHAGEVDPARIFDPKFRIELFLNTNGVGFIAAMTLLTHLMLMGTSSGEARLPAMAYHWISMAVSGSILFLTRSRTAALACLLGVGVQLWLMTVNRKHWKWAVAVLGAAVLLAVLEGNAIFRDLAAYYSLFDKYRDISNATNRTEIWSYVWSEVILKNPLLGIGPGQVSDLLEKNTGYFVTNSGMLLYLSEVGFLGTAPYLAVLGAALQGAMKSQGIRLASLALLAAGGVESMGETMFFSTGNVGSLLFLFAMATALHGGAFTKGDS
jgi:hypothetical protein